MSDLASKLREDNNEYCAQVVQVCTKCFDEVKNQNKCKNCNQQRDHCLLNFSQVTVMCKNCYDSSKTRCSDCGRSRTVFSFCSSHKTIVIVVTDWDTYLTMGQIAKKINRRQIPFSHCSDIDDYYYMAI